MPLGSGETRPRLGISDIAIGRFLLALACWLRACGGGVGLRAPGSGHQSHHIEQARNLLFCETFDFSSHLFENAMLSRTFTVSNGLERSTRSSC